MNPEQLIAGLAQFTEHLGFYIEGSGSPGFVDGDIDAFHSGLIHARVSDGVASGIDCKGNHSGLKTESPTRTNWRCRYAGNWRAAAYGRRVSETSADPDAPVLPPEFWANAEIGKY